MKRRILILCLILCLALSLTACSEVSKAEDAIDAIGTVTMESQQLIESAEMLYKALSPEKQAKVDNYDVLTAARVRWNQLSDTVGRARRAINGIGTVTIDSGTVISSARSAYDDLIPEGLTSYVADVYPILLDAEGQYDAVVREYARTLLEEADALLGKRKYQDAYDLYSRILTDYSGTDSVSGARSGCADALTGLATSQYNSGKLEDAMYAVEEIINAYGVTDSVTELKEKIEKRLTQSRPTNGRTFKNTVGWGQGEFTVKAGSSDACIKLEDRTDSAKYILFYVRANESATVKVKDGSYIVKYATGDYWYSTDSYFGRDSFFSKADDTMTFETTYSGSYVYYSTIEITLYQVVGGNMGTTPIAEGSF